MARNGASEVRNNEEHREPESMESGHIHPAWRRIAKCRPLLNEASLADEPAIVNSRVFRGIRRPYGINPQGLYIDINVRASQGKKSTGEAKQMVWKVIQIYEDASKSGWTDAGRRGIASTRYGSEKDRRCQIDWISP